MREIWHGCKKHHKWMKRTQWYTWSWAFRKSKSDDKRQKHWCFTNTCFPHSLFRLLHRPHMVASNQHLIFIWGGKVVNLCEKAHELQNRSNYLKISVFSDTFEFLTLGVISHTCLLMWKWGDKVILATYPTFKSKIFLRLWIPRSIDLLSDNTQLLLLSIGKGLEHVACK